MSLRIRLAASIALITALVVAGAGYAIYAREQSERLQTARQTAADQVRLAALVYTRLGNLTAVTAQARVEVASGSRTRDPEIPDALRSASANGDVWTMLASRPGSPTIVAVAPISGGKRVYVLNSYAKDLAAIRDLRRTIISFGLIASLAGALLGAFASTLLARPIRRSVALARRLADGDLQARLRPRGRDEIAMLGRALDEMAASLQAKVRQLDDAATRERRFSADVAHELRTPLTGLVAAASLLDDTEPARMVQDRARALAHLVEDLLEVMRLDSGAEAVLTDRFDLVRLVRATIAQRAPRARLVAPTSVFVETDPRRVERIVANLLDNAQRHGREPITVTVAEDGSVVVHDRGSGFGSFLHHAGERFALARPERGGGSGLGLAIAQGQANVIGARMMIEDAGGARVTLRLPRATELAG